MENSYSKKIESIIKFFEQNQAISIHVINDEAGLPQRKLEAVLKSNGKRKLTDENFDQLEPVLKRYGFTVNVSKKNKTIAIANHKGGVSKTTTVACLGDVLSRQGYKVLLIDFDPQGNLSQVLGIENPERQIAETLFTKETIPIVKIQENLWLAPSDISLAEIEVDLLTKVGGDLRLRYKIKEVIDDYDFVFIDCPPSLSKLTISALNACDSVLITMLPEASSMKGLDSLLNRISEVQEHINRDLTIEGIVFTMVKKNSVHDIFKENVKGKMNGTIKVFDAEIKHLVDIQKAQALQVTLGELGLSTEAYKCYKNLAEEYLRQL